VTDTEANTIVRPLYLFITIVIIKEGRTKKEFSIVLSIGTYLNACHKYRSPHLDKFYDLTWTRTTNLQIQSPTR
jgi:hypothetical protein